MKRISAALAVAALMAGATPAAADPASSAEPTSPQATQQGDAPDGTVAIMLGGVLLFVVIAGPLFGADSRPAWRNVDRRPGFRMVGSMRPGDWPPREFRG